MYGVLKQQGVSYAVNHFLKEEKVWWFFKPVDMQMFFFFLINYYGIQEIRNTVL